MTVDKHVFCVRCGYDLFGLKARVCPECGKTFSLFDPASYTVDKKQSIWIQVLSLLTTLWIGCLLGGLVPLVMMPEMPRTPRDWTVIVLSCLLFGTSAFLLRHFRIRSSLHLCLAGIVAEFCIVCVLGQIELLGLRLFGEKTIVAATCCITIPWLLGAVAGIVVSQCRHRRDGREKDQL